MTQNATAQPAMTAAQVCAKARDVIRERGWYQGSFCPNPATESGPVCVWGAINVATFGNPYGNSDSLATGAGYEALQTIATVVGRWVPNFNDSPTTTVEDVLLALKQAQYLLEQEDAA